MNQNEHRGPGRGLLLLIPIGLLIAKGVGRRRSMLAGEGGRGHRHGGGFGRGAFGPGAFDAEGRYTFTLPPKIESVLDAWHERVHGETTRTEEPSTKSTGTATV
jgi:hypothetical protein